MAQLGLNVFVGDILLRVTSKTRIKKLNNNRIGFSIAFFEDTKAFRFIQYPIIQIAEVGRTAGFATCILKIH
jgi:hypothetical protein